MTLILGLDTSTNFVGVALADNGKTVAAESHFAARQHAEVMAPTYPEFFSRLMASFATARESALS